MNLYSKNHCHKGTVHNIWRHSVTFFTNKQRNMKIMDQNFTLEITMNLISIQLVRDSHINTELLKLNSKIRKKNYLY